MANTRGGPGYAKLKSEYLRANLPDPQNVKNANTLSGALTMRWAHGHSVPVEYLATRALRKLPVVRSIADMKAQRNDGNKEASKAKNVQVSESQEGKVNQADTVISSGTTAIAPAEDRSKKRGFKRKRGMNRARTKKEMGLETGNLNNNLCRQFCKTGLCDFGKECKYDHDIEKYRSTKPPDLGPVCYLYQKYGYCPEGFNCRFADHHSDWKNFKQKVRSEEDGGVVPLPKNLNEISAQTRDLVRKQQYAYAVKKNGEKGSEGASTKSGEASKIQHTPQIGLSTIDKEWKKVDFKRKVYVAPLTTVGNLPFRRIVKEFGADITCGEMALSLPLRKGQNSEWALLRRHQSEDVFGIQLAGNKRDIMSKVAQVIENELQVDFIDLNLGCPIDVVCNRGMGAAMMNRPNHLLRVVEEMAPHISCPITVKMRAAHKLVHKLQLWNSQLSKDPVGSPLINGIAIHGRSRLQRYTKAADWNYIRQCRIVQNSKLAKIPIIGNGDVYSYVDWEKKIEESGSDTCLLARGVLQKPWLCTEIKEKRHWDISASERLDIYKKFVHYGLEHWGSDQKGVNKVRRFLLEWLSFTYRYIPVGLLERIPAKLNERAPNYFARNDLETLMSSPDSSDWIKISEMLLGRTPEGFKFVPKHKANAYSDEAQRDTEKRQKR
eukprot:g8369.t1